MTTLPEMKEQLAQLQREVVRGEELYALAQQGEAESRTLLLAAGIDPDGNIDAQIATLKIEAERANKRAFDLLTKLQNKVLQVTVDG